MKENKLKAINLYFIHLKQYPHYFQIIAFKNSLNSRTPSPFLSAARMRSITSPSVRGLPVNVATQWYV